MDSASQDRNLPASERKLKKSRDEGQVARSNDLSHLAVLGAGALAVMALAPLLLSQLQLALGQQLHFNANALHQPEHMLHRLQEMVSTGLLSCVVFAALVSAASILASLGSGGWVWSLKPVLPDFNRINPLQGFANLFSKRKLAEVVKMVLVTLVLVVIATGVSSVMVPATTAPTPRSVR